VYRGPPLSYGNDPAAPPVWPGLGQLQRLVLGLRDRGLAGERAGRGQGLVARGVQVVVVGQRVVEAAADPRGLLIYEGALSFGTGMRCIYRDFPYKRECGRHNDRRPSSKQAVVAATNSSSTARGAIPSLNTAHGATY
jgi:hypothetical protein